MDRCALARMEPGFFASLIMLCEGFARFDSASYVAELRNGALEIDKNSIAALRHLPIFIVHGRMDKCIDSSLSSQFYAAISKARGWHAGDLRGGTLRLKVYDDVGHSSAVEHVDIFSKGNLFVGDPPTKFVEAKARL